MKLDRDTEMTMLEIVVKPKIQEARECLKAGKAEEFGKIVARDIIGLLDCYKDSEMKKYDNAPANLKEAPNVERMLQNAQLFEEAVNLLWDKEEGRLRLIDERVLNAVENLVDEVLKTGRR